MLTQTVIGLVLISQVAAAWLVPVFAAQTLGSAQGAEGRNV
jgi:hypothetical protein